MGLPDLIDIALQEDLPNGDVTTDHLSEGEQMGRALLLAKEDLVLSGTETFEACFRRLDENVKFLWQFQNSDFVLRGQTVASIESQVSTLLKCERVALNFIGHLSGISTLTRCFVKEVEGTNCQILDTRKTLPGLRELEKRAVTHGHGSNHRMTLSDAVLIKENHIHAAGSIKNAVEQIRRQNPGPIEVEVNTLEQVQLAVDIKTDRILLDNMSNEEMEQALKVIPSTIETEASGNMTIERVKSVAELGVNAISIGAITHSAPSADFSLILEKVKKGV